MEMHLPSHLREHLQRENSGNIMDANLELLWNQTILFSSALRIHDPYSPRPTSDPSSRTFAFGLELGDLTD